MRDVLAIFPVVQETWPGCESAGHFSACTGLHRKGRKHRETQW
jgi:hypothetical protein